VKCLPNSELDAFFASDTTPDDARELSAAIGDAKRFATACRQNTGALLAHVDTLSTVRDMDVARAVLGDSVLTYFGASYGTFIGAWYAQEFPWRVGRLVLDGVVDPSLTSAQYAVGQAMGFQRGLDAYLADCGRQRGCPLRGNTQDAYATLSRLVRRADADPLRTSSSARPLTQSLLVTGIAMALYDDRFWPALTRGLTEALQGDGSTLLVLADTYLQRDDQGQYAQTLQATNPIYCLDHGESRGPEQIAADAEDAGRRYPPLGADIVWSSLGCAEWPIPAVMTPQRLTAAGAAPILLVGTRGDPATPYEWAKSLAGQLSSARLLTWEGQGHTAYKRGSDCVDRTVEDYLVAGRVPAAGVTCG
jgi:pimeloyl-ACP methyl ester carboxylesterase